MPRQKPTLLHVIALAITAGSPSVARAQDGMLVDWSGFYIGAHAGGGLALVDVGKPFGPTIFGDTLRTPGLLAGGQAGYNWQFGSTVLGIEADASLADMDGTHTCFAYSGFYVSANCRAHIDALGTLTGRLGWALPFDGRTLVYGKAGLAWQHSKIDATANDEFGSPTTRTEGFRLGWTLGAGAERAISSRWSLKAEYDFLSFNGEDFTSPASGYQTAPAAAPNLTNVPGAATHISQDLHLFKIGVNYRFGAQGTADDDDLISALAPTAPPLPHAEIKAGLRYVRGWGQFHKDLGIQGEGLSSLASRLTYESPGTDGAEAFARLDARSGAMVKGVIGLGSSGGHLNDEDWGLPFAVFVPYSNTLSNVDNDIKYGIVDVGYNWWQGDDFKFTPFIGYAYFQQHMKGLGCRQIANPNSDCLSNGINHLDGVACLGL
ncbi:MAG TPA: porin family protein [Planctomycetes bacterium]|nr:porin family protein [Planctomycetota bacterium]